MEVLGSLGVILLLLIHSTQVRVRVRVRARSGLGLDLRVTILPAHSWGGIRVCRDLQDGVGCPGRGVHRGLVSLGTWATRLVAQTLQGPPLGTSGDRAGPWASCSSLCSVGSWQVSDGD